MSNIFKKMSKNCRYFAQKEHPAPYEFEFKHEKFKIVLPTLILEKKHTPNFTKFVNP